MARMKMMPELKDTHGETKIISRHPSSTRWLLAVLSTILLLMTTALLFVPNWQGLPPFIIGALVIGAGLSQILNYYVEANASGVRWRNIFGTWRTANWDEVSDYYHPRQNPSSYFVIETKTGTLKLHSAYPNVKEIAEFIQQHATSAPARHWEIKGDRDIDPWPRTFPLAEERMFTSLVMVPLLWVPFVLSIFAFSLLPGSRGLFWSTPGVPGVTALVALVLMFPTIRSFLAFFKSRQLRWHTVVISPDDLIYQSSSERISIPWREVQNCKLSDSGTYTIVTSKGDMPLPLNPGHLYRVMDIMSTFLPAIKRPDSEDIILFPKERLKLSRARSLSSYSYQPELVRMLTALCLGWPALLLLSLIMRYLIEPDAFPDQMLTSQLVLALFPLLPYCLLTHVQHRAGISLGENGMSYRFLWTHFELPWKSIQSIEHQEGRLVVRTVSGDFQPEKWLRLARREEFITEVKRRLTTTDQP